MEKHYTHKSRHYHNLDHVENLLRLLSDHKSDVDDWASLFFAVVYHDAVYNVLKSDNEEKSASMAEKRLAQIHFPLPRISVCKDLILATKSHTTSPNRDGNLLMDADLSILGADWGTYSTYTEQVRKEYSIYPDWVYKPGRKRCWLHFWSGISFSKRLISGNGLKHVPGKIFSKKSCRFNGADMARIAFKMQLRLGQAEEYQRRHDALWPEIADLLHDTGIHDYSVFLDEETYALFGVLDVEQPARQRTCPATR